MLPSSGSFGDVLGLFFSCDDCKEHKPAKETFGFRTDAIFRSLSHKGKAAESLPLPTLSARHFCRRCALKRLTAMAELFGINLEQLQDAAVRQAMSRR